MSLFFSVEGGDLAGVEIQAHGAWGHGGKAGANGDCVQELGAWMIFVPCAIIIESKTQESNW